MTSKNYGNVTNLGVREPKVTNEVFVASKRNVAQLSHIFVDDGGVFGSNLIGSSKPVALLPAVPATSDAIYFGCDTSLTDSGWFNSLAVNIDTQAVYAGGATLDWEYWNGAWVSLSISDHSDGGASGESFAVFGVNPILWNTPAAWAATAINGVTAYWVRAVVALGGGSISTTPTQAERDIYTIVWPYVEIQKDVIAGDMHANARELLRYFPNVASGNQNVQFGLRSYDRGPDFTAFINYSQEQNPAGLTITKGIVTTTWETDPEYTPSGDYVRFNPANTDQQILVDVDFDASLAYQYAGDFRAFVRLRSDESAGSAVDWELKLQVKFPTAAAGSVISERTVQFQPASTNQTYIMDFGIIRIPASRIGARGQGTFSIRLLGEPDGATEDINLIDLVLIPVDEWYGKIESSLNESSGRYINVDNVSVPGFSSSDLRITKGDAYRLPLDSSISEPPLLQSDVRQRLWFLTTSPGTPHDFWLYEDVLGVQLQHVARYLALRGDG